MKAPKNQQAEQAEAEHVLFHALWFKTGFASDFFSWFKNGLVYRELLFFYTGRGKNSANGYFLAMKSERLPCF
jgi:hypothetical protein